MTRKPQGDDVNYHAVHRRLDRRLGRAKTHRCHDCGEPAASWSYIGGDPNEKRWRGHPYSTDPSFYVPRCLTCHSRLDNGGERGASAKLNWEQVRAIRAAYRPGQADALARQYGVSRSAIYCIIQNRTWKEP